MPRYVKLEAVDCSRGAPMGRREWNDLHTLAGTAPCIHGSLLMVRMRDGYDSGGAYWGYPHNLWCAEFSTESSGKTITGRVFIRADSRFDAIGNVRKISGWETVLFRGQARSKNGE